MIISFEKYVGAGNDFIFLAADTFPSSQDRTLATKKLCDRQWGIGADGCVFIKPDNANEKHFIWDFYNSDGSQAEMCGNAARCAILYCKNNFDSNQISIETRCGEISGQVKDSTVEVQWVLTNTSVMTLSLTLSSGKNIDGFFINTGVPHFVIEDTEFSLSNDECLEIQNHSFFAPDQTNVTLLSRTNNVFKTKSFERGVRDFTLACGTGVIACAFVLKKYGLNQPYTLQAPGGSLNVEINKAQVKLIGPAQKIFSGQFNWKD